LLCTSNVMHLRYTNKYICMDTKSTSFRLSAYTIELLKKLSEIERRTQTAILEMMIEKAAKEAGIKIKKPQ
jgi:hypothetical protein